MVLTAPAMHRPPSVLEPSGHARDFASQWAISVSGSHLQSSVSPAFAAAMAEIARQLNTNSSCSLPPGCKVRDPMLSGFRYFPPWRASSHGRWI